jgi:hypothetical protein
MGDIVAEFAVPFIFSISSLPSLDNSNTTAVYVSTVAAMWLLCPVHKAGGHVDTPLK